MSEDIRAEDRYRAACSQVFRALRAQHGWSLREFGAHVDAAHTTLYAIERADAVPGIDILDRVASACGLDLVTMMRLIIDQLEHSGQSAPMSAFIATVETLTPNQRAELLSFAGYLRYRDNVEND